nr:MAG TPA: hypothetical protein [Podoviridae sp. ctY3D12]
MLCIRRKYTIKCISKIILTLNNSTLTKVTSFTNSITVLFFIISNVS